MVNNRFLAVASLAAVAVSIFASSPVGHWKGKINAKTPPMPTSATPQQRQMYTKAMAAMSSVQISMDIKANKTFLATIKGGPGGKQQTRKGTWTQSGSTVSITDTGTGPGGGTQVFTFSKDGRKLSAPLAPNNPAIGSIVFSR